MSNNFIEFWDSRLLKLYIKSNSDINVHISSKLHELKWYMIEVNNSTKVIEVEVMGRSIPKEDDRKFGVRDKL